MKRFMVAVLISMTLIFMVGCSSSGPIEAFNNFVHEVEFRTDPTIVMDYLSAQTVEFYEGDPRNLEPGFMDYTKARLEAGVEILDTDINKEVARIKYRSISKNGKVYTAKLLLENGKWKIDEIVSGDELLEEVKQY